MDLTDPFAPQQGVQTPQNTQNVSSQWDSALNDPNVRTALLQFGISMLQPPSWGDTFGSRFGRAVGDAGEAVSRREAEKLKEENTRSKIAQRGKSSAQDYRAQRLDLAERRFGLSQEKYGLSQLLAKNRATMALHGQWEKARQQHEQQTSIGLGDSKPFPSFEQWLHDSGMDSVLRSYPTEGTSSYPDAVRGQTDRPPGNYNIPGKGPMYWDGFGWYPPRQGAQ